MRARIRVRVEKPSANPNPSPNPNPNLRPQAADAAVRAQDHKGVERRCGELLARVRARVRWVRVGVSGLGLALG